MNPAETAQDYLAVLARRAATAPRDFAMLEAVLTWGLGAAAVLFLLLALVRRSATAAVSFSLLTLTGLIVGIATGRLAFLPPGTSVLVLSLYACAALLFLTACVRVARDNAAVGALVLVSILALLALGGASALGLTDGAEAIGWALAGLAGFAVVVVLSDVMRGDRAAVALTPGVSLAALSPAPMLAATPGAPFAQVAMPLAMLAGGTLLATVAASFLTLPAQAPKRRKARPGHAPSYADDHAFFGEVSDPSHAPHAPHALQAARVGFDADLARPPVPAAPAAPAVTSAFDTAPQPEPARAARPAGTPLFAPAVLSGAAEAAVPGMGAYEPEPLQPGGVADPASSRWSGVGSAEAPSARPAPDEYVWDALASPEVRAGGDAYAAFGLGEGTPLAPEDIRAALAPASLGDFDDEVLGGPNARTGPFRARLTLAGGEAVTMDGTRQVDPDGLLSRLSARIERAGALTPLAAPAPLAPAAPRAGGADAMAALDRGEIAAHFQPIVRLAGRDTVGFEALARWQRPSGETLDAHVFVPDLIRAGRGLDLAERVASDAARELGAWLAASPGQGQFVSVNVAAGDLDRKGLAALIKRLVAEHRLPPGALVVELGEDRIKAKTSAALAAAKAIRDAGASLAVDDFGVGYSNLARLSKFRFDLVKTDHSLARAAVTDKKARAALKSVINVARKAGMPVIAEGIEDEETASLLEAMGCDFGQGYLFGRAEPAAGGGAQAAPQAASGLR